MAATSVSPAVNDLGAAIKRIDKIEEFFSKQAEREVKAAPPGTMAKFVPPGTDPGWPTQEQFQTLSKSYSPDMAKYLTRKGRSRAVGTGSAFKRLCEVSMKGYREHQHQRYGEVCDPNYSHEQLEREHGWLPGVTADLRALKSLNGAIYKASNMNESQGVLGGYAVPPDFRNNILTIEEEESTILARCMRVPMSTKTATWPSLDITTNYGTGKSPYEANVYQAWQPEAATINQTNAQLRQFELTNWDMVAYIVISNDLLQDNAVGLDMVLQGLLASSEVFYLEYALQNGLGANSSMPLGVLNAPCTIGIDRATASTITVSDVVTMYSTLQSRSMKSAVWHAHQSTIPKLAQLVSNSTTGQFAFLNPNGEGVDGPLARDMPMRLFGGGELHFTQTCQQLGSTGDLRLNDWGQYFLGERMGQQIAVSDQFLFTNNQIVIRSVTRTGGAPWLNSYVTDAQGFQVSPFVVLDVHT